MKKYLGAFAVVFLLSILVTLHHEAHTDNATSDSLNKGLPVSANNAPQAKQNPSHAAQNRERWWDFTFLYFGWPNGVTIWALVITFVVIAEQTQSTGAQLAFQEESLRPRLRISEFTRDTFREAMAGDWVFVYMKISNSGGLPAYGVVADTWIEFIHGDPPYKFSPMAKYDRTENAMNVHAGTPSGFFIPLHRKLADEEKWEMENAMGAICFRVKLTYRAFGDEVWTDAAYTVTLDGMQTIGEYSSET